MPNIKTGKTIPCCVCGKEVYKTKAYLDRGHKRITCGSFECKSKSLSGENNPFWGKTHSEKTVEKILSSEAYKARRKGGPSKGFKHSLEVREEMSKRMKDRWANNRDKMLAQNPPNLKPKEELRYRRNFSKAQRREWLGYCCSWCGSTEQLVLDHIIPIMCGGENKQINAQTLCQPCNLWKMIHVDRSLYNAGLGR